MRLLETTLPVKCVPSISSRSASPTSIRSAQTYSIESCSNLVREAENVTAGHYPADGDGSDGNADDFDEEDASVTTDEMYSLRASLSSSQSNTSLITLPARRMPIETSCQETSFANQIYKKIFVDKSTLTSEMAPQGECAVSDSTASISRERALERAVEELRETLKDTEERLHSLRLQHDTIAAAHRELRDTHAQEHDEAERMRRDCAQLHESAAALRAEIQVVRADREEAVRVQRTLHEELTEAREQRTAALAVRDHDARNVQDLQRQCKEMERILMRKHPDSVSALIGKRIGCPMQLCNIYSI